ncbi:unnamed protein product [Rotaria sp. Silwood2]|nr:unnamed protein product [Rotaria sp. Silwood2]CAF4161753.1 unnamed protein product [Rotaria sp. Silwood2]
MATVGGEEAIAQRILRVTDVVEEPLEFLAPISGYGKESLVTLEEAVKPLVPILPEIQSHAYVAKQRCKKPADELTQDESASIMLYTMGWDPLDECLYMALNNTLRARNRQEKLKPWYLYLRLFLNALLRLPLRSTTSYRGVKLDLSKRYIEGETIVWWAFSSCTTSIGVLKSELFMGNTGARTMFTLQCKSARDISKHSYYAAEDEVLLMAATQFKVISSLDQGDLHIIQLEETLPPFSLLQPVPVVVPSPINPTSLIPPKVENSKRENDQSCVIGQDTQISWKFSGIEKPRVTWFFNSQPLPTNDRFQVAESDDGTSTLSIRQVELADQGVYTARATNAIGEAEAKTTLNIACIKPVINTNLNVALQVTKGETMTLKIGVNGTPKPDIVWMRDNDELTPNIHIQVTTPTGDDDTYTLTILNIQPEDQGDYSAKISNVGESLKSNKCKVTVSKSPVFVVKPTTQKVKQGVTAIFVTKVDGYPTPTITWVLNRKPLTAEEGSQVQFNTVTGEAKLSISNVDLQQHAGSITCRLENSHGYQEETVQLAVLVAPIITAQLPNEQEIVSGRDVTLKVVVRGSPQPSAQWYFKDRPIGTDNASIDEEKGEYQLLIKQTTVVQNEGTYRVVLKNEVDEVQSTPCLLTVLEPVKLTRVKPTSNVIDLEEGKAFDITIDTLGRPK